MEKEHSIIVHSNTWFPKLWGWGMGAKDYRRNPDLKMLLCHRRSHGRSHRTSNRNHKRDHRKRIPDWRITCTIRRALDSVQLKEEVVVWTYGLKFSIITQVFCKSLLANVKSPAVFLDDVELCWTAPKQSSQCSLRRNHAHVTKGPTVDQYCVCIYPSQHHIAGAS